MSDNTPNLADLLGASTPKDKSTPLSDSSSNTSLDDLLASGGSNDNGSKKNQKVSKKGNEEKTDSIPENTATKKSTQNKSKTDDDAPSLDDLLGGEEKKKKEVVHFSDLTPDNSYVSEDNADKNIFQKTFADQGEEKEEHIIDAIENYDGDFEISNVGEERQEDPFLLMRKKEEKLFKADEKKWKKFLIAGQSFGVFVLLFGVTSFLIFSFLLDTPKKGVFGNFVSYNYGIELIEKTDQLRVLDLEVQELTEEIKKNNTRIEGLENNTILDSIISDRIKWKDALAAIQTVRKQAQSTEESKSVFFENYATKGNIENGSVEIIISGKAYSYQNVFQKVSSLVDAFNESEYFDGAQIRRFNKTDDGRQYYMPFSLQLTYYPKGRFIEKIETKTSKK